MLLPGDRGGGEFALTRDALERCTKLLIRLQEEFDLCLIDLSAGRSHRRGDGPHGDRPARTPPARDALAGLPPLDPAEHPGGGRPRLRRPRPDPGRSRARPPGGRARRVDPVRPDRDGRPRIRGTGRVPAGARGLAARPPPRPGGAGAPQPARPHDRPGQRSARTGAADARAADLRPGRPGRADRHAETTEAFDRLAQKLVDPTAWERP